MKIDLASKIGLVPVLATLLLHFSISINYFVLTNVLDQCHKFDAACRRGVVVTALGISTKLLRIGPC